MTAVVSSGLDVGRDRSSDALDAARYRALKRRYGYFLVRRLLGQSGYSSATKDRLIDAYADTAVAELAAWDALTLEEQREQLEAERSAAEATP